MTTITLRDLFEAGVHYGHLTRYWEPSMAPYIFGSRNKIHIIDLEQTLEHMERIHELVREAGRKNNTILFVGTKRGIKRLEDLEYERDSDTANKLTKKEALLRDRTIRRLQLDIGGIRNMNGLPDALFVIDIRYESIAVAEARKLGIPIIAVVDTNVKPSIVDHMIAGNDDSVKAVQLYMNLMVSSYQQGQELYEQSLKEQNKAPEAADVIPVVDAPADDAAITTDATAELKAGE